MHVAATDRRTNGLSPVINHRRANQIHVYTGRLDGPWLSDSVGTTPGWSDRCRRGAGPARPGAARPARHVPPPRGAAGLDTDVDISLTDQTNVQRVRPTGWAISRVTLSALRVNIASAGSV